MNLAIRGIKADHGPEYVDTFRRDRHRDRRALIEADLVDCMVALPCKLVCRTQIPVCLWFLAKKHGDCMCDKYTTEFHN